MGPTATKPYRRVSEFSPPGRVLDAKCLDIDRFGAILFPSPGQSYGYPESENHDFSVGSHLLLLE